MAIGAALQRGFRALPGEAVLHHHIDRAAQRVEAEHRIAAPHIHAGDGGLRDGVPVDGVAKGFVQPHAVLIDRQALRRALQRRGLEAVKAQILEHGRCPAHRSATTPAACAAQRIQHRGAMLGASSWSALRLCSAPGTLSAERPISEPGRVPYTTTCSVLRRPSAAPARAWQAGPRRPAAAWRAIS